MCAQIRHSLYLALRLIDTTTGLNVVMRQGRFQRDGKEVRFLNKGSGFWALLTSEDRADFHLSIHCDGYEPLEHDVQFGKLDKNLPLLLLHMIPTVAHPWGDRLLTVQGQLPGLTGLTAVRPDDNACLIRGFDPRKKIITLFNPHKLSLEHQHYGLVNPDTASFEPFTIVKHIDDLNIKIDRVLETKFGNYFPITPVVFGAVTSAGDYHLSIRDNRTLARWVLRREQGEEVSFQSVDFRIPESCTLTP